MSVRRLSLGTAAASMLLATLSGCQGGTASTAESTAAPEAGATSTGATSTGIAGKWTAKNPRTAFLRFDTPDAKGTGRVTGGDGCNGIQGDYTLVDTRVTIERGLGTLKECTGVDEWLGKVASVNLDGDTLTVHNDRGDKIGTLERAAS